MKGKRIWNLILVNHLLCKEQYKLRSLQIWSNTVVNQIYWYAIDQNETLRYQMIKINTSSIIQSNYQIDYFLVHLTRSRRKWDIIDNMLVEETVNYVIEQIYVYRKSMWSSKLIFKKLLIKIAIEFFFKI